VSINSEEGQFAVYRFRHIAREVTEAVIRIPSTSLTTFRAADDC
jgi:hypothetical protein